MIRGREAELIDPVAGGLGEKREEEKRGKCLTFDASRCFARFRPMDYVQVLRSSQFLSCICLRLLRCANIAE